jgi:putative transposase
MVGDLYNPAPPKRRADKATWDEAIQPVLDRLAARDEEVAGGALRELRSFLHSYRDFSDESLVASALRNSESVRRTLVARRLPPERDLWNAAVAAEERAQQGIAIQDVLNAYRLSLHHIRDFMVEAAIAAETSPLVVVEMLQLIWDLGDAVTLRLAMVHRETEVEVARHDERQRAEFLRALVFGSAGPAEIRRLGPAYGLPPDLRYIALRGRPAEGAPASELARALTASARDHGYHAFVGVLEGDVVGVVQRQPVLERVAGTVGVGPAADLAALEPSFAVASRVLEVAERFGRPGVYGLEDLSLRVAVAAEDELGEVLQRRYLQPLEVLGGRAAEMRETVAAFIEQGLNVKAAAVALAVHQNTVRYRLARFEELTGARLEQPTISFEVWWALQRAWLMEKSPNPQAEA